MNIDEKGDDKERRTSEQERSGKSLAENVEGVASGEDLDVD